MENCIFATTPYQIITASILVKSLEGESDLYIVSGFDNYREVAERLQKTNLFRQVIPVDEHEVVPWRVKEYRFGITKYILTGLSYFRAKKLTRTVLAEGASYDRFFYSFQAYTSRTICNYLLRTTDIEAYLFDDGTGSYIVESKAHRFQKLEKLLKTVVFGRRVVNYQYKRYLYSPDLFHSCVDKDAEVYPINKVFDAESLSYVFQYEDSLAIPEDCMMLDQFTYERFKSEENACTNYIKEIISRKGITNLVVKRHPRDKHVYSSTTYGVPCREYVSTSVPFEVILLNQDIEEKILITMDSTAVCTPVMLFGKEPVVIVLYKLLKGYYFIPEGLDKVFEGISQLYQDKKRFIFPSTEQELYDALEQIQK